MAKLLSFAKPAAKTPTAEQIEQALQLLVETEYECFTNDLVIARGFWRKYPAMVESAKLPEPFRAYLMKEKHDENNPAEPFDECADDVCADQWAKAVSPGLRESLLPEAVALAQIWLRHPPRRAGGAA